MASSYPSSYDALPNPGPTTKENEVGYYHDEQHANANDAIEAVQTTLGLNPQGTEATVVDRLDAVDTRFEGVEDEVAYQADEPVDPPLGMIWIDADDDVVPGSELPPGGSEGQVLTKASAMSYDVVWADIPEPPPSSGGGSYRLFMLMGA